MLAHEYCESFKFGKCMAYRFLAYYLTTLVLLKQIIVMYSCKISIDIPVISTETLYNYLFY
jgi:hypothetical protein